MRGPGLFKEYYKHPRRDRRVDRRRRLVPHRRRRLLRRGRPPEDHRPREGRRQARRRRAVRARIHREQAQVLPATSRRRWRSATAATVVCAFINIDMDAVGNWAERRNLAYSGYTDLAAEARGVRAGARVRREGQRRPRAPSRRSRGSQIHRFLILHKELDPDDDELTRTRKVRRGFIAEKYAVLVDALYGGARVAAHRDAGAVRGRPHRHRQRRPRDRAMRDASRRWAAARAA